MVRPVYWNDSRGFTLLEVMVAAVIAVIAVLGLAYTFSTGRGLIDRYATARDGLAAAERRIERLAVLSNQNPSHPELAVGSHPPLTPPLGLQLNRNTTGTESWTVSWWDDPIDNNPSDANPNDYLRARVVVKWLHGSLPDSVVLTRNLLP